MSNRTVYLRPHGDGYRRSSDGAPDAYCDGFGTMSISVWRGSDGTVRATLHPLNMRGATPALQRAILRSLGEAGE